MAGNRRRRERGKGESCGKEGTVGGVESSCNGFSKLAYVVIVADVADGGEGRKGGEGLLPVSYDCQ